MNASKTEPRGEDTDWLGVNRRYQRLADGALSSSLWELVTAASSLCAEGVRSSFGLADESACSCVEGISLVARAERGARGEGDTLEPALLGAMERVLRDARAPVIALSGGVDSALLLALVRKLGVTMPPLATLVTGWAEYDEVEAARSLARAFGARVEEIGVQPSDYLEALPAVVRAAESPLYNLHPVSRYLLARALRAQGARTLITGDAADQVFADRSPHLYLPLVGPLTAAGGLALASPFFDAQVHRQAGPATKDKRRLRNVARALGVPELATDAPKKPRLTPPLDLSLRWPAARVARAAASIGVEVRLATDADRVRFTTLGLFDAELEAVRGARDAIREMGAR